MGGPFASVAPVTVEAADTNPSKNRLTLAWRGDKHRAAGIRSELKAMKSSRAKHRKPKASIVDSIRRPLAPPGHPIAHAKPEEKASPAQRKAKYKRRPEEAAMEED